jgi:hypothetical protein
MVIWTPDGQMDIHTTLFDFCTLRAKHGQLFNDFLWGHRQSFLYPSPFSVLNAL